MEIKKETRKRPMRPKKSSNKAKEDQKSAKIPLS